jgi:hypothetical protein
MHNTTGDVARVTNNVSRGNMMGIVRSCGVCSTQRGADWRGVEPAASKSVPLESLIVREMEF